MTQGLELSPKRRALLNQLLQKKGVKTADIRIPRRTGDSATAPLSFSQQRLWFLEQLESGSAAYNLPVAARLRGELNVPALIRSYNAVIQRHESLRTTFTTQTDQPVQMIAAELTLDIPLIDLSSQPADERNAETQRLTEAEAAQPFNLSTGPLLRALLLRLEEHEHIFMVTMHHIISDGWSGLVFIRELMTLYDAYSNGREAALPELPIQYADFSVWQRNWLQGDVLETHLAYWKAQLGNVAPILELPTDRPRPPLLTYKGAHLTRPLAQTLLDDLQALSRREGVTLFMTLFSAFNVLLYRYTRQADLVVGTPVANRSRAETEAVIGFFINILALRSQLSAESSFRSLLQQTRETTLEAYKHQDVPFEMLVDVLQPQRDLSYSPIFQVMFILQNASSAVKLPGLPLERLEIESKAAQYDLTLTIMENEASVTQSIEYSTDLFDDATIVRMQDHFEMLLASIVANPTLAISQLSLLSQVEKQQVLFDWNQTQANYPQQCVHQLFEAQAERTPESIALTFNDQHLTYQELNAKANQLAHSLRKLGVEPGTLVGIYVERSLEMVIGLLAVLKAGGAYLPLDPTYPSERIQFMLQDAAPRVVLTQQSLVEQLPPSTGQVLCLDSDWPRVESESVENPIPAMGADSLAYVLYTSGSTGKPKGVCIPHRALVNFLVSMQRQPGIRPEDTLLAVTTISFDIAGLELYLPLISGARVELVSRDVAADGLLLSKKLSDSHASIMQATPATWRMLLAAGWNGAPGLKVLCGGEALPADLAEALLSRCGELWNMYGPTETTIWSTIQRIQAPERISIGKPIANTQVYVLDDQLNPLPIGIPGDLYIGGDGLALGYLHQPELTAEKFIRNPFLTVDNDGLSSTVHRPIYHTGDLARWLPNGELECLGRSDTQVKLRGFRIELGEIEAVLAKHPDVQQNVVIVREDKAGDRRLVAYLVSAQKTDPAALRSFLRASLPEYMLPSAFVCLDALPLTPNGKVNRKALPAPESESFTSFRQAFVAPRTPTEEALSSLWADLLGVKQVSVTDNFFALGGHSLLATQLLARIRRTFAVELPMLQVFESPSVAELAARIDSAQGHETLVFPEIQLAADELHKPFPMTDVQQAYWIGRQGLFELGNISTHAYGEFDVAGLDLDRFGAALRKLIAHHPMLRAIILPSGQQQILPDVPPYQLATLDLRATSAPQAGTQLEELREWMSHQVFATDTWPLFEVRATVLDEQRTRLHFSFDILLGDAWSMRLMMGDLARMYADPNLILPTLDLTFRDYVLAEEALRQTNHYQRHLTYWQERLDTLPSAPDLPLAKQPSELTQPHFSRWTGLLPAAAWEKLKSRASRSGVTPSGLVLAAFAEVLRAWSKHPHFTLNLTLFNRLPLHPQVNDIVGDFTSLTLVAVENAAIEPFENRAREVQRQLWKDLDHRLVSGIQVLRQLSQRQGGAAVLMPVVFTSTLGFASEATQTALSLEPVYSITQTPQVWLDHQVGEQNGNLAFNWDVVAELFPDGMVDEMFAAYCSLLQRLSEDADLWQAPTLGLMLPTHLQVRLAANATEAPIPTQLMHGLFEEQVARQPQAVAVVGTTRTLTYAELAERSRRLGRWLREQGARPNQLVAVVMEKGWEQVVATMGILQSGAAYLPVDPALPFERRQYLMQQGECQIALTQSSLAEQIEWPEGVAHYNVDQEQGWQDFSAAPLEPVQTPTDLAYVIYTSGSTGQPKGVMIDHRGAVNTILDLNPRFAVTAHDRVLALSALNFDLSVYDIFGLLAAGGSIVMPAPGTQRDPSHWAELVTRHGVTLWNTVPALMEMLVEYLDGRTASNLSTLRLVMMSGDWIPVTLPGRIWQLAPQATLMSLGGATEASIWSILYPIEYVNPAWKSIPYGKPMLNQRFHVLNQELEPCPTWVPGELYIGGIGLALGYWRDENKSNERFITHPRTGERLYKTGDLGRYLPDGNLEFLGREDFQVKIRGYRIELGEIEAALMQHPRVQAGIVTAVRPTSSDSLAGASKQLVAYIVPVPAQPTADAQVTQSQIFDPVERFRFKLRKPAIRHGYNGQPMIQLNDAPGDAQEYLERRSYRRFVQGPISLERFSRFLGGLRARSFDGYPLPKYRYASAGGLYPVQTYIYVKPDQVEGLPGGTYYYHPLEHQLMPIRSQISINAHAYEGANQAIFQQAAFGIFLVAQMKAITPLYGKLAADFCLLEAGSISHHLETLAPQYHIGLCQVGGFEADALKEWFDLDEDHHYLHSLLGGAIDPQQMSLDGLIEDTSDLRLFMDLLKNSNPIDPPIQVEMRREMPLKEELHSYLQGQLPEYMLPRVYILLDALPLSPNGKVDRKALPVPDVSAALEETYVAPGTVTEKALGSIWSQVLGLERIGAHDNFFDLGGHSLLATQVISRMRDEFKVEIPLRLIFEAPDLATFAREVDGLQPTEIQTPILAPQAENNDDFPLSFSQEREWFLEQFSPGTSGFLIPFRLQLDGDLDVEKFRQAVFAIVQRHQVLRTTFKAIDGQPVQVIANSVDIPLPVIDLQGLPETAREAQMDRYSAEFSEQPFDLSQGPLLRAALIRTAPNQHFLVVVVHHIAADRWSLGILAREFTSIYRSLVANQPINLPDLPLQYADFARWQKNWLMGETLQEKLRYWKEKFAGELPVLHLPTDHPRPAVQTYRGARKSLSLPLDLAQSLKAFSRREGVSLFMTLLAAFKTLLHRYTNQTDICVGTFIANRNRRETESLIGFFVNTLALRTNLSGDPDFQELLQRVQDVTLEAYANQDVPFEKVLTEIQPARAQGHTPLFQVMFVLQNSSLPAMEWPSLSVTPLSTEVNHSYFDLTLWMFESEDSGLVCYLDYNIDLFCADTITRMLENYQTLLASVLERPEWPISNLSLLGTQEKAQLAEWSEAGPTLQTGHCIHELFEAQAEQSPDALALFFDGQTLSYGELNHRANQLAHYLKKSGVGLESLVGICVERSVEMIVAMLGVLKAGAAYVPMDPAYPRERLSMMIADSQPAVLLTQEILTGRFVGEPIDTMLCLDRDWPAIAQEPITPLDTGVGLDNLAYVIYTSGSTGTPKGVLVQHGSVKNYVEFAGQEFKIEPGERVLQFASINFDSSAEEIYPTLTRGATLVLRTESMLTTMQAFLNYCEEWQINVLDLPTAFWHELTAQMDAHRLRLPNHIRLVIIGGERALTERYADWQRLVPPRVHLLNTYGPTESTIVATLCEIQGRLTQEIPIGRPVAGNQAYILDKNFNLVPVGVVGELYIAGTGLARGYLGRPNITAERFIPNPFPFNAPVQGENDQSRLYRTGDLARYRADGQLEFVGRADDQVKIRGFRIELGEIETTLRQMDGIHDVVVLAREDTPGDRQLVAYLVSLDGKQIQPSELRARLKERLPDYMIPSAYVWLEAFPLTPSQKVDRRALHAPERDQHASASTFVAPQTPLEESLAEIWANVLRVSRVGRDDNFFDLGGHSLLATQLFSRIREVFQVELPLRSLFEAPTVAGLALQIETAQHDIQGSVTAPIQPAPRDQELALSYAQERMWFYDQLSPGNPIYNVAFAIRINGSLNVAVLEQSLNEVVRRQESLRTTFVKVVGKPAQTITAQSLAVPVKDLLHLSEAEREVEIQRLIEAEGRWSFDLAAGPLFRLTLLRLGESEHVALITMHHIISDGWSVAVLGQEVMSLYAALARADSQPSLPGLPIQYADFARWQREWFQSKFLGRQLNYWKKQLAGELPILELPADHVRPEKLTGGGASLRFRIPREQAFSIQALSRRENVTMFMLLLTAFKTLLYRYTGQKDLLVGSPIANRTRVETENLIGCFINPLVFRTDFSGNPTFREALRRVRDVALEAYANQDVPFENLVKELKLNRELRHMPVFQVLFILHNAPIQSTQPEGLTISSIETHNHASPFDVTMTVWATEPEIEISIEYKTDLFDATTIMRMRDHFQVLLGSVAADPDQAIATVPLLPEPERSTLLKEWSGTYKIPSQTACMHHLFEAQVLHSPDAIAVIAGDQTCTYLALNERANQLAHYLQQLGVRPEMRVGICLERSIEMLVGILGILKSGGAYVPLDPAYPPERLGAMLGDTDQTASGAISVILTQENLLEKLPIHQAHTVCLDRDWESVATHSRENPTSGVTPENLAYFIYTSGSTGTPKGVMVQHSSLVNYVQSAVEDYQLGPQERVLQFASISFDTSVEEIYPSLISGATLLLRTDSMLAISTFVEYCTLWKLTVLNLPTAFWHEWVAQMNTNALIMPDSIRLVIIGGERAIPEKVAAWYRQVGPNIRLVNTYGATEATAVTTLCDLSAGKTIAHEVPIGRPINNLSVYILDQELNPVPIGVPGELYIGGAGLARGYFGHPALTAERFIPNPMLDIGYSIGNSNVEYPISNIETRLYRTGDLARFLPNGEIEYLGRIDHLVKIRGFRIELGEIEAILSKHPQVQETVVVAYDDPLESVLRGAGKRLVAYIIPQKPLQPSASELRSFLESYLPKYMVPSAYVLMDSFPLTPTRKLDRRALPQPDFGRPEAETVYVAPRNEIERQISSIWQDALGIDKVGIYDNFFDLGGHSLLLVQVHSRLQECLETEISIIDLFQYPSIDALVSHLSKTQEQSSAFQGSQDRAQKQRDAAQRQRERMQERRKQTIFEEGDDEL